MESIDTPRAANKWRFILIIIIFVSLLLMVKFTPLGSYFRIDVLRTLIADAGAWGILVYCGLFIAAALLNIPGTIFLVFSILVFGYVWGSVLTYVSALSAAMLIFAITRSFGGNALHQVRSPFFQRMLAKVESNPIATLIILRIAMQLSPLVSYTLGLSGIRTHHFWWGNAIGMVTPIAAIAAGMFWIGEPLLNWLGIN